MDEGSGQVREGLIERNGERACSFRLKVSWRTAWLVMVLATPFSYFLFERVLVKYASNQAQGVIIYLLCLPGIPILASQLCRLPIRLMRGSVVVVGADGVFLRSGIFRRLIPYDRIVSIDFEPAVRSFDVPRVKLRLVDGKVVEMSTSDATALESAIRWRRDAWTTPTPLPAALARGGRSGREWLEALRNLAAGTGYRAATVGNDYLWTLLDDPHALPAARAAAATALAQSDGAQAQARLRIVAASMAHPKTRRKLDRIANATDDAVLVEALEALQDEAFALSLTVGSR